MKFNRGIWITLYILMTLCKGSEESMKKINIMDNPEYNENKKKFICDQLTKLTETQKMYVYATYPVVQYYCKVCVNIIIRHIINFFAIRLPSPRTLRGERYNYITTLSPDTRWIVANDNPSWTTSLTLWDVQNNSQVTLMSDMETKQAIFTSDSQYLITIRKYSRSPWLVYICNRNDRTHSSRTHGNGEPLCSDDG